MLPVLIQSLILASAGLLSVGSITIVILLLLSNQGWRNGLAYAMGYTGAYTLIGILAVVMGYRTSQTDAGEPSLAGPILVIVFGSLLLWLAFRNWREPASEKQEEPRFFSIVDNIAPPKALGFGAMVSVLNFKNLALFLTAISVVVLSNLQLSEKIFIAIPTAFVFCLSVIIPVTIYITFPSRANDILTAIKQLINRHSRNIGIFLPLVFGLLLFVKGITGLL